ncbi:MAG: TIGR03905 family TSCPD domain-containing protein [Candidatus Cryptobacteroides sp.]|nr:TIGR03905 family TSCPD domain-containing protein [Candidatus Cryptobacteroides sp.]
MKAIKFIALALLTASISVSATGLTYTRADDDKTKKENSMEGSDYQIVKDEVVDGIRYVTATPSQLVCSNQIDIELEGDTIRKVVFTRGCNGNGKGIGALIQGMKVDEAIRRLRGITCGKRPTSCPDQLARVLETISK